jgi:hypothetical protein
MKKAGRRTVEGEMRAEYDFSSMRGALRGKYARQFASGSNVVVLEPDLTKAFPSASAVNAALRAVLNLRGVVDRVAPVVGRARPTAAAARGASHTGRCTSRGRTTG